MAERFKVPEGHLRRAAGAAACPRADPGRVSPEAGSGRLRTHRHPDLRGHRPVRTGRGRVHGHRPEADVHLRGPGRTLAHTAAGSDRIGLPRLPRARHAEAGPAGEALDGRLLLPPRTPPGGSLPSIHPGGRRGDRLGLAADRRGDDPARERHPDRAWRGGCPAPTRQPRHPGGARGLPRRAPRLPALA